MLRAARRHRCRARRHLRWNWPKRRVADAIVEADPVHAQPLASRVAVAHLQAPQRRLSLIHIVERALHRLGLRLDAMLLPLAVDADVERDGIAERRARFSTPGKRRQ